MQEEDDVYNWMGGCTSEVDAGEVVQEELVSTYNTGLTRRTIIVMITLCGILSVYCV